MDAFYIDMEKSCFEVNEFLRHSRVYLHVSSSEISSKEMYMLIQCFYYDVVIEAFWGNEKFNLGGKPVVSETFIDNNHILLSEDYVSGVDTERTVLFRDFFCLKNRVDKNGIVVWGHGKIGKILCSWLCEHDFMPKAIIDTSTKEDVIHNIEEVNLNKTDVVVIAMFDYLSCFNIARQYTDLVYPLKILFGPLDYIYMRTENKWLSLEAVYQLIYQHKKNQRKLCLINESKDIENLLELLGLAHNSISLLKGSKFNYSVFDAIYDDWYIAIWKNSDNMAQKLTEIGLSIGEDFYVIDGGLYSRDILRKSALAIGHGHSYREIGNSNHIGIRVDHISDDASNLVVLGGSTTDGWRFVFKTWPHFLNNFLELKMNIINMGVAGYRSCDEVKRFVNDAVSYNADTVIVYSSVNDIFNTPMWHNPYELEIYDSFAKVLSKQLNYHVPVYYEKVNMSNYKFWINNMRYIKAIADLHGVKCYCIIQPSMYTKKKLSQGDKLYLEVIKDKTFYTKAKAFYNEMDTDNMGRYDFVYDLRHILDGRDVYFDWCHVTEEGNKIVAKEIANIINRHKES